MLKLMLNDSCRISVVNLDLLIKFLILILYCYGPGSCHFLIQIGNTQTAFSRSPYFVTVCRYFRIYECFFYSAIIFCKETFPFSGRHICIAVPTVHYE